MDSNTPGSVSNPTHQQRAEPLFVLVLRCKDCGSELNRSYPLAEIELSAARVSSAFAAGPCPNGCRSTFSDLNLNTTTTEEAVP